jgi:signal transduction histidine kinase
MTSIISYADMLLGDAGRSGRSALDEGQRQFLLSIRANAERMVRMTDDLGLAAGAETLWTSPQRKLVDINELIEMALADGAVVGRCNQIEEYGLKLDLELPGDLPPVEADPDYLRRVLANLLSNACLASTAGGRSDGRILVRTSRSNSLTLNGNGFVIVSIRDSGGGLSDEALERVFDRGRPSQTPPGLGESGAGLALVKTLVEAHGGRLWVESQQGIGTTFSVVLPANEQARPSPAAGGSAGEPRHRTA